MVLLKGRGNILSLRLLALSEIVKKLLVRLILLCRHSNRADSSSCHIENKWRADRVGTLCPSRSFSVCY